VRFLKLVGIVMLFGSCAFAQKQQTAVAERSPPLRAGKAAASSFRKNRQAR